MIDEKEIINQLNAFYHIYPNMQKKVYDLEKEVENLKWKLIHINEERKYQETIIKQYIGKIQRIEQFLIENGLIRLLGKKVTIKPED